MRKTRFRAAIPSIAALSVTAGAVHAAEHPLDPLDWKEHWAVLKILADEGRLDAGARFTRIALRPPEKDQVWRWRPGRDFPRAAEVVIKQGSGVVEAVIDLDRGRIAQWQERTDVEPTWLNEEYYPADAIDALWERPEFLAALEARGVEYPQFVDCEAIPSGYYGEPQYEGRRIGNVWCNTAEDARNTWPRQISGLQIIIDVETGEILNITDEEAPPTANVDADIDLAAAPPTRKFPGPILVSQPDGPGFAIDGHLVSWDQWRFHLRSDQRVGLIVSTATFGDEGDARQVLYEGHISEIFVPYQAPYVNWYQANYLDAGEYSAGGLSDVLEPGIHCPGWAHYIDAIVTQDDGRPADKRRVACIFERYAGEPLWLHGEHGRPKRELVVRMSARLDNYDYLLDWIFQQDGEIRVSVGATGLVAVKSASPKDAIEAAEAEPGPYGAADRFGRYVDEHVVAVNHSHYFNFRFDLDVDGRDNSFSLERLRQMRLAEDHVRRSVWVAEAETPARESRARLRKNLDRPALWRVINPEKRNRNGYPVGYQVAGGVTTHTLLAEDDMPRRRAGFIDHDLWVTPYAPRERYAAGDYPTLSTPGQGLPAWTAADRNIQNTDLVVWYTMGMHHVVRAEDWPVMPVLRHDVSLRPFDFFDENPGMNADVTP